MLYDAKKINKDAVDHFLGEANNMEKAKYPLIFFQAIDTSDMEKVKYDENDPVYTFIIDDVS